MFQDSARLIGLYPIPKAVPWTKYVPCETISGVGSPLC